MSTLDDLIDSRDQLLDWVAKNALTIHETSESRIFHRGPFSECDDEPCESAHAVMTEAHRVMEADE